MSREVASQARAARLFGEATRAPSLSAERERELIGLAQAGDRRAMEELCAAHLRLSFQIAARYRRGALAMDDLVGEGSMGLIEAIHRFDLSQPTRLSTYATWWIRARIRQYAYRHRSMVPPPSTRGARVAQAQLARAERALAHELGRTPTRAELAARLAIPESDVISVMTGYASTVSLTCGVSGRELDTRDDHAGPEETFSQRESQRLLEQRVASALSALGARDRLIIRAHFLEEEASMAQLGSDLGITRQRVSQIVQRVRRKLEKDLRATAC